MKARSPIILALSVLGISLSLLSCGDSSKKAGPVIITPPNGKVDLSQVNLTVSKVKITYDHTNNRDSYRLSFKYTLDNHASGPISFISIYAGKDDLIEVNLSDSKGLPLTLGKRPQEGLTLAAPRPMLIPHGKTTRSYTVPITPDFLKKGEPITVRVRFHAPSRYDELRSSLEAPHVQVPWPQETQMENLPPLPEDNPLTSPLYDATLPSR
jgi:hypothetical protein